MGFFKKLLGVEPRAIALLKCNILADEDHRYFVTFNKLHPNVQRPEFVRIILHYYAKMLYNFDPSDEEAAKSAAILQSLVDSLLTVGIRLDSDILPLVNLDDVVQMVDMPPQNNPRKISTTLYFVSPTQRYVTTEFPREVYHQHLVFSFFALLKASLHEMDSECVDILDRALRTMNKAYDSGESFSSMESMARIPTEAYLSAIVQS